MLALLPCCYAVLLPLHAVHVYLPPPPSKPPWLSPDPNRPTLAFSRSTNLHIYLWLACTGPQNPTTLQP